jgi:omega-6 fatty acid desaturase (delta-12 desaturase)
MEPLRIDPEPAIETATWQQAVAPHQKLTPSHSVWQLVNTLVPYAALWALMIWTTSISYWLTLPLLVPAAGLLIRIFIIHHDCGHGSFFRSRRASDFWGGVTGLLTFTPYRHWQHQHALHHASSGNLDRRGAGDFWTMTVQEYLESSRWKRLAYRLTRNPFVLIVLGPLYLFLIQQRSVSLAYGQKNRASIYKTNLALLAVALLASATIGFQTFLLIQIPTLLLAGVAGVWLFYVQHQFEGVYWERSERWDFTRAALEGSSYYDLPRILHWFTGNIGFHHIHHLSPIIPNYNLERCHRENPVFGQVKRLTLWSSLKSLSFRLWDEQRKTLVGYRALRAFRKQKGSAAG